MEKVLKKDDLWNTVVGGAALATGGGGASPSYDAFSQVVDPLVEKGLKFKLTEAKSIPQGKLIFVSAGVGGGLEKLKVEKYMRRYTSIEDWIKEMDRVYPLPSWAEVPNENWMTMPYRRMVELKGQEPVGYMPFEIGPNNYREFVRAATLNKSVVDADTAGYRAVPEVSLATLNVVNAPIAPLVVCTSWGDMAVFEKFLSWQRAEDLVRHIAITSGGGCMGMLSFSDNWIKEGTVHGTLSLSMNIGSAINKAKEKGDDPISAMLKAAGGFLLFKGEIAGYTNEGYDSFTWGNSWIKGQDEYAGHTMRTWFKNENQISWIDEKPHVTCPDPFTVVDQETGQGLSNFRVTDWNQGRKVAVWGMKAAKAWRKERGLKIYRPKHFGFDIEYVPIEEKIQ